MNHSTRREGVFPVSCVAPRHNTKVVLFAFHNPQSDVIGYPILEACRAAAPHPGFVDIRTYHQGGLDARELNSILDPSVPTHSIVCGPAGFTSYVSDLLEDQGRGWARNLTVLSSQG